MMKSVPGVDDVEARIGEWKMFCISNHEPSCQSIGSGAFVGPVNGTGCEVQTDKSRGLRQSPLDVVGTHSYANFQDVFVFAIETGERTEIGLEAITRSRVYIELFVDRVTNCVDFSTGGIVPELTHILLGFLHLSIVGYPHVSGEITVTDTVKKSESSVVLLVP
jgi:hypothetical protein